MRLDVSAVFPSTDADKRLGFCPIVCCGEQRAEALERGTRQRLALSALAFDFLIQHVRTPNPRSCEFA